LIGYFAPPLVAIGPRGNAVIALEATWANRRTKYEFSGPNLLIYRRASGCFDKPVHLPGGFLASEDEAAVDTAGRAIIVSPTTNSLQEIAVSPNDRVGRQHRLWSYVERNPEVASNAQGQAVIAWTNGEPIEVVLGNAQGANGELHTIAASPLLEDRDSDVTAVMSPQGTATVFWAEEPKKEEKILHAQAITPGTQPIKVASSEPVPSVP
jgi:hypothetical protein